MKSWHLQLRWLIAALPLTLGLGLSQPAVAGDNGTNASPLTSPALPVANALPDSGVPEGYFFNLRPVGEELGSALADRGIYLTGRTLQQAIGITNGGLKTGTVYQGFNIFGVDLDMHKIVGIQGGSVHILVNDLAGLNTLKFTGADYLGNRAWSYNAASRFNELSYEQNFGPVDIRVGRVPVGREFDTDDWNCEFIYGTCSTPQGFSSAKGYPSYLSSSYAAVAKVKLPRNFYFNAGVYQDEPTLATVGHYNWPGEDWALSKTRGVSIPLQLGYRTTFKDSPYPSSYAIGGVVNTQDYSDPIYNSAGENRLLDKGSARLDHGQSGIWLMAQQAVFRPDMSTQRALSLFAEANFRTSGYTSTNSEFFAGLTYHGPFSGRPFDQLNFVASQVNRNPAYNLLQDTTLSLEHMPGTSPHEEFVELNYDIALAPGMMLKPSFDYIWNPDQVTLSKFTPSDKHAVIIGAAFSAYLPETLGLPRLGGGS